MRTEQLAYLQAIKKHGNMSKASAHIALSPQALSTSMRLLEKELGFPILIADNKGVQFTEYGEELLQIADRFFADVNDLKKKSQTELAATHLSYTFHMPESYKNMYFNTVFKTLHDMNNDVEVNIYTYSFTEVLDMVKNDEINYAFFNQQYINGVNIRPDLDDDIVFEEFPCEVYYKLICHKSHLLAKCKIVALKSIMKEAFLLHVPSQYFMEPIIQYSGQSPIVIPAPNVETLVYLLSKNKGVFLTPISSNTNKAVFDLDMNLFSMVKTKEKITEKFGIIRKKNTILTDANIREIELVKRILQ